MLTLDLLKPTPRLRRPCKRSFVIAHRQVFRLQRRNGSVRGKSNAPTNTVASGVWGLNEVEEARNGGNWPVPRIVYIGTGTSTAAVTTTTFTAQSIGAAAVRRYVIVAVQQSAGGSPTITSVSIGGNAATLIASTTVTTANVSIAFYGLQVDTGTTANIVVVTAAASLSCSIAVWSAYNLKSFTPGDVKTSTANPGTVSLTTVTGGVALAMCSSAVNNQTIVWTGLTEQFDFIPTSSVSFSGSSDNIVTGSSLTVTATRTGSAAAQYAFSALAFS